MRWKHGKLGLRIIRVILHHNTLKREKLLGEMQRIFAIYAFFAANGHDRKLLEWIPASYLYVIVSAICVNCALNYGFIAVSYSKYRQKNVISPYVH